MSSKKYRKLLTNLPSMAAVVNAFESQEVQLEVYRVLIAELEEAAEEKDGANRLSQNGSSNAASQAELAHVIVDGDSIHVDDDLGV